LREQEFDNAFKRYDGLGAFAIKAEKNGTTLWKALASYEALEGLCARDPCAGIDAQAQIFGWNPRAVAHAYAARHGVIEPPPPAPEPAAAPDPEAVVNATIAAFRADPRNEFMAIVENAMRELLLSGQVQSLHEAYDQACMESPHVMEIKMARNRQPNVNPYRNTAVQQSRAAAKAIGGAPS
jgi:hypothetical protein